MLTAYALRDNYLEPMPPSTEPGWLDDAVWIDLVNPTEEEIQTVEDFSKLSLPDTQETEELEASSHYEVYPRGLQLNCLFLHKVEGSVFNTNVAFLFDGPCLISLCARKVPALVLLQRQSKKTPRRISDPLSIIISLLEIKIDRIADLSEDAYLAIEKISHQIFQRSNMKQEEPIDHLSRQDDLNGKIRLCLMDGQRDLNYLLRRGNLTADKIVQLNDMLEDIKTLLSHTTFLSERIDFLLNAALGFINIEQNKIIKIFSIAAVVFMPPTVIASIYGMNFQFMPELQSPWGYPVSLLLMLAAGISPYIYFKRKGWL